MNVVSDLRNQTRVSVVASSWTFVRIWPILRVREVRMGLDPILGLG